MGRELQISGRRETKMKSLFGAAALLALACGTAAAEPDGNTGKTAIAVGMLCDTAQQVERYVALYNEGATAQTALETVNNEHSDPRACEIMTAMLTVGEQVATVAVTGGSVQVVAVTIVATKTGAGWQRTAPMVQYTAVFSEAKGI